MPFPQSSLVDSSVYRRQLIRPTAGRRAKWRLEVVFYRMLSVGLRMLPGGFVARLGRVLGAAAHRALARRRAMVARNLRIAFGHERSSEELAALNAEVFRRAGANLLASLHTASMDKASLSRAIEVRDGHVFAEAIAGGRGVVMVLAHMGNWEALAQWFPFLLPAGRKAATVYRPLNNPVMNAQVVAARARRGLRLFSKDDSPLAMATFLREGGALAVLSDQRAGISGELVPFFGRLTSCTPIPSVLARRTRAAVVGLSLRTLGPGRWELKVHALKGEPGTANMMELLERMLRESPADVFWMQDRWKVNAAAPQITLGKSARSPGPAPAAAKPRRALVWMDDAVRRFTLPEARPDDVAYEYCLAAGPARPDWLPAAATLHRRSPGRRRRAMKTDLTTLDRAAPLPFDFVYSPGGDAKLRAVAKSLGLPVVFPAGGAR